MSKNLQLGNEIRLTLAKRDGSYEVSFTWPKGQLSASGPSLQAALDAVWQKRRTV